MNNILNCLAIIVLGYLTGCMADCGDFKKQCQTFCLAKTGGVATNQCWGTPKYRFCKCDDMTVYHVPGYTCDHPSCPEESKGENVELSTVPNPSPLIVQQEIKNYGCKDFKMKCQKLCLKKSGGVATNQCWGNPKYRYCKCDDQSVHIIPGYTCDHSTCPKEVKIY